MTHDEHDIKGSSEAPQFAVVDFSSVLNRKIAVMMPTGSKKKLFII